MTEILLSLAGNGRFAAKAACRLGDAWGCYINTCRQLGLRFSPAKKHQTGPIELAREAVERFERGGLQVTISAELSAQLDERSRATAEMERTAAGCVVDNVSRAGLRLYPFQRAGAEWLARRQRALLADEMGLGKTIQVLAALPRDARVLVICPAAVQGSWAAEFARWRSDYRVTNPMPRRWRWPEPSEVIITSYGRLPTPEQAPSRSIPPDLRIVADEAHYLKSGRSKRTKAFRRLSDHVTGAVWALSGTPVLNPNSRAQELWSVLRSCRLEVAAFGNWAGFVRAFAGHTNRWGAYEWGHPTSEAVAGFRKVALRRLRADVLPDLPPKMRRFTTVKAPAAVVRAADEIAEFLERAGIDVASASKQDFESAVPFDALASYRAALARARIPAMLERVAEYEDNELPLLVFSAHREPIEELGRRKGWGTILGGVSAEDRTKRIESFQSGQLCGMALTYGAGGVGITLTRAAHVLCVDLPWTPAELAQAEDRACRIGQTAATVAVEILTTDHPVDQRAIELITEKQRYLDAAVNAAAQR